MNTVQALGLKLYQKPRPKETDPLGAKIPKMSLLLASRSGLAYNNWSALPKNINFVNRPLPPQP
jgi:hypothetical protein